MVIFNPYFHFPNQMRKRAKNNIYIYNMWRQFDESCMKKEIQEYYSV